MSTKSTAFYQECNIDNPGKGKKYCIQNELCTNSIILIILICLAAVTEIDTVEIIETDEDVTICYTTKFAKLLGNIITLEDAMSKNKYSAYQNPTFIKLDELLQEYFCEMTNFKDSKLDDIILLAHSFIKICRIQLSQDMIEQEHLHVAEISLIRSLTLLRNKQADRKTILGTMTALNELSNVYTKLKNPRKSLQYLNEALKLYVTYTKEQDKFLAPINILAIIGIEVNSNTVYLLDQQYMDTLMSLIILKNETRCELIDMEKITTCMHKLLKKQLENIPVSVDYISWTIEAVRLSEYFLSCDRFMECKNHLVIASVIMARYLDDYRKIKAEISAKKGTSFHSQYKSTIFIIDVYWVRYGLALLRSSGKYLLNQKRRDNFSKANSYKFTTESAKQSKELLMFTYVEKEYEKFMRIDKDNYITNYYDAKIVFVNILKLLNQMKTDKFVSEDIRAHAEIAQYVSKAYKYLAFYEHDKSNHIKLQKRRIEILEDYLKMLHLDDQKFTCSFIWFELAVINSIVLRIKLENLDESKLSAEELKEIDQLVKNSKTYFLLYYNNADSAKFELENGLTDQNYQVTSTLNMKYSRKAIALLE